MTSPEAGWYPDGSGQNRWWDGNEWTDHYQPVAHAAPQQVAYAAPTKKPVYKRAWFIILMIFAMIFVLFVACTAALVGSVDTDGDGPKTVDGSGQTSESKDDGPGTKGNPVAVGETVELEGTRYTVKSAKTDDKVGGQFSEQTAGGIYVVIELEILNVKDETKQFMSNSATFVGSNNKRYETDNDGTFAVDEPLIFEDMQPDVAKTGALVYDVPKDAAAGGVLEVSDLYGRGEAYIDLGLK